MWSPAIANLSFVCFICQNFSTKPDFLFKYLYPEILLCNHIVIFKSWEFYCSHPFAGNEQSVHIVSFPCQACAFTSFLRAPDEISLDVPDEISLDVSLIENFKHFSDMNIYMDGRERDKSVLFCVFLRVNIIIIFIIIIIIIILLLLSLLLLFIIIDNNIDLPVRRHQTILPDLKSNIAQAECAGNFPD